MCLLGPFMFKLISYKEKTNNLINCLIRLGLYANSVNSGISNHSILVTCSEYQAICYSKFQQHNTGETGDINNPEEK